MTAESQIEIFKQRIQELERENATLGEALVEMENAGWPCRLVELPALFRKTEARVQELEQEVVRLKGILKDRDEVLTDFKERFT